MDRWPVGGRRSNPQQQQRGPNKGNRIGAFQPKKQIRHHLSPAAAAATPNPVPVATKPNMSRNMI
jgi:hypothetical protein